VKRLPRISDASHLRAWVSRAAFHAALDLKKKARRRAAHERRTAEMDKTPALTAEQVEAVHTEIARLDGDLRRVVVEHYFEKRPLRDLAAEQAISEVAVWKRLQKAKERLRVSLTSTGFAAALLGLDSLLEALEPVRAPEGFVQTILPGRPPLCCLRENHHEDKADRGRGSRGAPASVGRGRDGRAAPGPGGRGGPAAGEGRGPESEVGVDLGGRSPVRGLRGSGAGSGGSPGLHHVPGLGRSDHEGELRRGHRRAGARVPQDRLPDLGRGDGGGVERLSVRPGTEEFSKHLFLSLQSHIGGQDPGKPS
jgi:hypothetical protein